MSAEFASNRDNLSSLTAATVLEAAASPQELASSMSEAQIRDRITVLDEDIETDLDIIEKARQRVALSRTKNGNRPGSIEAYSRQGLGITLSI